MCYNVRMKERARKKPAIAAHQALRSGKLRDVLDLAEQSGLLRGTRTKVVRGRMPEALVARAKARTGIKSDSGLIELALANLAVADDYAEWLLSQRGTIPADADLEF